MMLSLLKQNRLVNRLEKSLMTIKSRNMCIDLIYKDLIYKESYRCICFEIFFKKLQMNKSNMTVVFGENDE